MRKIITIDGQAASGKSSIASLLAKKIGYIHLNTGKLYRAVTLLAKDAGLGITPEILASLLETNKLELVVIDGESEVLINGKAAGNKLFDNDISLLVSQVASQKVVRDALIDCQKNAFPKNGIVAEGRDMGTIIFPNACAKFFVKADAEVRATRRAQQLGINDSKLITQIKNELLQRDRQDTEREIAPTIAAPDALIIDNSSRSLTETIENIYHSLLENKLL